MFRYARAQRGRYREHWQFGVESLGSDDPAVDAEVIALQAAWFARARAARRPRARAQLDRRQRLPAGLSRAARGLPRALPQRALGGLAGAPRRQSAAHLRLQGRGRPEDRERRAAHHRSPLRRLRRALRRRARLPRRARRRLPRHARAGARASTTTSAPPGSGSSRAAARRPGSISGGGRYDGLAEQIGGKRVPGVGFGCGTERVVLALEDAGVEPAAAAPWTGSAPARTTAARPAAARAARAGARARAVVPGRPRRTQPQGPAAPRRALAARASSPSAAPATARVASSGTERPRSRSATSSTTWSGACGTRERLPGHAVR